jgi:hypothetical protein
VVPDDARNKFLDCAAPQWDIVAGGRRMHRNAGFGEESGKRSAPAQTALRKGPTFHKSQETVST